LLKVAINGFGRIGRSILRALYQRELQNQIQIVAINEPADLDSISYMLRYDSTYGRFDGSVEISNDSLIINGDQIAISHCEDVDQLNWRALDIDLVLECSGSFKDRNSAQQHLDCGAKKILISHPAQDDVDATVIYGLNHQDLTDTDRIISNGSCSTNCLLPVLKIIDDAYGIEAGTTTTIHSAMNDQPVIDAYHSDLRRTRAAVQSIIPVDTALPAGIARIMPQLENKIESLHVRVPTLNVSALDVTLQLKSKVSVEQVNKLLTEQAEKKYSKVLGISNEPHASVDFNQDAHSGVIDATQTKVSGDQLLKLFIWFDNEWAFANRMLDVALLLKKINTP